MKYNFDEIIDRKHAKRSYSTKWDDSARKARKYGFGESFPEDKICLQTADMDFKTAPAIIEAMKEVSEHGIYGYSAINDEYREAVCHWFKTRQNWEFNPEDIMHCNGTHPALVECIKRFTKPGEGIIVLTPSYSYHDDIESCERTFVGVEMKESNGYYTIDFDALEKACEDEHNTLFVICHPHNPTGRVWNEEELLKMAEISRKHHVLMVSDEVHSDIIRKNITFKPMMKVVGSQGLIALTAVNKTFNLAGLSCTNMIVQDEAIKEKFAGYYSLPNPFGVAAAIAAYTESSEWVDALNDYLDGTLQWCYDFVKEKMPQAKCIIPEGSYVIWLDLRGYGLTDEQIKHKIINEAHLVLQGGSNFDSTYGQQFQRICIPSPRSMIQEAFERLEKVFA